MTRILSLRVTLLHTIVAVAASWSLAVIPSAHAANWPQEITTPEGTIVIYQPQPESLNGNVLNGRAAVSFESIDKKAPIFGAMWFTARIDTDTDSGTATIRDVRVTKVRWPDVTDAGAERFTAIVEGAVPKAGYAISMERLSASLATATREQKSLAELKNEPPKIVFDDKVAVLLLYDGAPKFTPVENSHYERALNTPYAVARNKETKLVYLTSGTWWYESKDPLGPWVPLMTPPADLQKMMQSADTEAKQSASTKMPVIVVATQPTELIVTDGKPNWTSLAGGQLLYVKNTETPWLREVSSDKMYLLLSGRWFSAKSTGGPWTFVRPDKLPASFKDIPPGSEIGGVRVSVAGTEEANDAILDAQIPQTAAIKRKDASLDVIYDGAPKFERIAGTSVSYAVNTGNQVLEIHDRYYAVDSGVWFTSAKPTGPWAVADKIPEEEIQKIPPSSPVYNTTYVHIYESTPEVVYVGYTPGYMWSYPYYGVPVYGTGWYYPPYWGAVYYPHPVTYGMHIGYNPWTGWHVGMTWSNGFVTVGIIFGGGHQHYPCCGGGWYGGGYAHVQPLRVNPGDINIGNSVGGGNRGDGGRNQASPKNAGRNNTKDVSRNNVYNQPGNSSRNANNATAKQNYQQARPSTGRENNVYADKNGNVAQRNGDRWESREQGSWQSDQSAGRDQVSQGTQDRSTSQTSQSRQSLDSNDMNRSYESRQSGTSREMSRPSSGGGRRR